jgi:hypothetical protein
VIIKPLRARDLCASHLKYHSLSRTYGDFARWQLMPVISELLMDLEIRQKLQQALEKATSDNSAIVLECADGSSISIELDLICYENQVEATAKDGTWVTVPYTEIADVHTA